MALSRHFQVFESSDLTATSDRDTGEQTIQFVNEHKDKDGAPIKIPNMVIITIPVFENGSLFRLPVRFRYRKSGSNVKFVFTVFNPERAFDMAFDKAVSDVAQATGLPLFIGSAEKIFGHAT